MIKSLAAFRVVILCLAATPAAADPQSSANASLSQRMERDGVAIDFSISPIDGGEARQTGLMAGQNALVAFRITDARTHQPLSGMRPRAWLSVRLSEQVANELECKDKVRSLMSGQLAARADIDLNSYLMLTLNNDKTISVINPQISFNATKLENLIPLPGDGADWALSKDKNFLYVSMPQESAVAVIDTTTRKLISTLVTGGKSTPRRIALEPDGRYVWIALDAGGQIVAIDTVTNRIAGAVPVGEGLHDIAFTGDSRFAFVTNSASNTVSAVDIDKFAKFADIGVGKTPSAIAYGKAAKLIYVASINGDAISAIVPERGEIVATIPVKPGVVALGFEPQGRFALAVNQLESTVSVIDSATNAVTASSSVVKEPDQVSFTERYAYIRGLESEKFSLLELSELRAGKLAPMDIQAGRQPPSAEPKEIGLAKMIAPTPEGNSVMIANAADRMMYFYQEGMMAPMGALSNYERAPRGLMILDRSLSETSPGAYSTPVKLTRGGRFDVMVLIDQPRLANCFQVPVAEQSGAKQATASGASIQVKALFDAADIVPGKEAGLRFKITDSATLRPVTGLADVRALVFAPPGVWQQRRIARELGDGVYALEQVFPRAGVYNVMLAVESRGARFADLPPHIITVNAGGSVPSQTSSLPRGRSQ